MSEPLDYLTTISLGPGPTADDTRKRLWVDVFYREMKEASMAYDPRPDDDRVTAAAKVADLAVAEYDKRFGSPRPIAGLPHTFRETGGAWAADIP